MPTNLYGLIEQRPGHPNFGKPFYVGIGTNRRPATHLRQAATPKGHSNRRLHDVLAAHVACGVEPRIVIFCIHPTRAEAVSAEIRTIATLGRIGVELGGVLCNLAAGGNGPDPTALAIPEVKERLVQGQRAAWADPEVGARRRATLAITNASLTHEKRSAACFLVPETERRARGRKGAAARSTEQVGAKVSAANLLSWNDPEVRSRRIAGMRGAKKTMTDAAIVARRANLAKAQKMKGLVHRSAD